jgi:hypothetical protein
MSEYLDIVEERDGYRVRLEYDDSPEQPYDDGATPIFTVERSGYGRSVEAFNKQAEPYVSAVAEILDRFDLETLERFVKIFYGAIKLDSFWSDGIRGHYVAFDTEEWREKVGAPVESLAKENYLSEVQAWAEGDVYGYLVEEYDAETDTWEEALETGIVSDGKGGWRKFSMPVAVWGFYGREWAEQAAREALTDHIEHASKQGDSA